MTLHDVPDARSECAKLQRLLDRYRDLLAHAKDEFLRRGIERQIGSLEQKLRECDEEAEQPASSSALDAAVRPIPLRFG